ncbi:MAG: UDP-2,3-diacylglucosamine diphosphatase LpxI [Planctomycetales bacterium]|nr:UDP-2,3-diacylglucosamine diphosphatase LpxI [Planctomycetales bacterium]
MPAPPPRPETARSPAKTLPPGERIGLIAGFGRFPILFAERARAQGIPVVAVGIRGECSPDLGPLVERLHWCGIARLGRLLRLLKAEGLRRAIMAGKIHKARVFGPLRLLRFLPDWKTLTLWYRHVRDRKDDTLLGTFAEELSREGIALESAADYCPELLAPEGVLTYRRPTAGEEKDIQFGWELAKRMGGLDVGQTVAVREQAVLAVEAIEGTDAAIRRAGTLCKAGGFTVVKVAKPAQDMRYDVPTVGPETVRSLVESGARLLAIEAGKTYLLDPEETLRAADAAGIAIVSRRAPA